MTHWTRYWCGLLAALPLVAQAQRNPPAADPAMQAGRAQILVVGTVHLREMPGELAPASLDGLLARLAAFKPDIIAIESRSGEECDLVARHPDKYGAFGCESTAAAKAATGLDVPAAMAEVSKLLKAWPAQATPAQRRRLAALYLAANARASALVQWLQLADAERHAGDGLDGVLVGQLEKMSRSKDETSQITAPLAARLGLQQLHAMDDHTGDNIDVADEKAFGRAIEAAWAAAAASSADSDQQLRELKRAPDLLPLYRFINAPAHQRMLADMNVGALMRAQSPQGYPQMFVAGWEIRNLRMVANIRQSFRERPGARVLVLVGASHKSLFDSWLGQLQGVDIVDVATVLQPAQN